MRKEKNGDSSETQISRNQPNNRAKKQHNGGGNGEKGKQKKESTFGQVQNGAISEKT